MISPALNEGQTKVTAYIPEGVWYDFFTREAVGVSEDFLVIDCPITCIPLHVRGGAIIPTQVFKIVLPPVRINEFLLRGGSKNIV